MSLAPPAVEFEAYVRAQITRAGYYVKEIVRCFPPRDTGEDAEVLFIGRERNNRSSEVEPLTAYLPSDNDRSTVVATGW